MTRVMLIALLPLLAACNVQSKNPAASNDNVNITANESGDVTFSLPFAKGQMKIPGMVLNGGHTDIDGVKLMPGSSVTGVSVFARDHGATTTIAFAAPAPPADVRSYFVDQFNKQGGEAAVAGDAVTGKAKDGSPFVIHVASAPQGARGTIEIQSKD